MSATAVKSGFIWYELLTSDPKAATDFYSHVLGWKSKPAGMPGYTIVSSGSHDVAGICAVTPEMNIPNVRPMWLCYLGVADVDASLKRVQAEGGKVLRKPEEIPGVGRFAVVADPHGVPFYVMTPNGPRPVPLATGTAGTVGWNELHAGNAEEAFAFYSKAFGWTKTSDMDMGPMGIYHMFTSTEAPEGGMMTRTPEMPAPTWAFYWNVPAIDAAVARVKERGGNVIMGPHQVPTGQWVALCLDPQNALFALLSTVR